MPKEEQNLYISLVCTIKASLFAKYQADSSSVYIACLPRLFWGPTLMYPYSS